MPSGAVHTNKQLATRLPTSTIAARQVHSIVWVGGHTARLSRDNAYGAGGGSHLVLPLAAIRTLFEVRLAGHPPSLSCGRAGQREQAACRSNDDRQRRLAIRPAGEVPGGDRRNLVPTTATRLAATVVCAPGYVGPVARPARDAVCASAHQHHRSRPVVRPSGSRPSSGRDR
jgi:hypothetical protein